MSSAICFHCQTTIFLDWTKFKAVTDYKIIYAKSMIFAFIQVENIVGKGENACYQHYLLYPQCFQKASSLQCMGSLKVMIVWQSFKALTLYKTTKFWTERNS